jgi:hypothetical protein
MDPMSVTIGNLTFERSTYDADGDVLYLHVAEFLTQPRRQTAPVGLRGRAAKSGQLAGEGCGGDGSAGAGNELATGRCAHG